MLTKDVMVRFGSEAPYSWLAPAAEPERVDPNQIV